MPSAYSRRQCLNALLRMLPLRDGSPGDFAAFRAVLRDAGYTEAGICARSGAATVADAYEARPADAPAPDPPGTAGDVLYDLLFGEGPVAEADARRLLGDAGVDVALRLGVLRSVDGTTPRLVATVALYPIEGLYFASDLTRDPADPAAPFELAADAVYPAITTNTRDFLAILPRTPCRRLLELCGGAGAAALLMADRCAAVTTSDIASRSVRMAAWNARLNGITNVRSVESDVFAAFPGETFDRIVAHPPYMPALSPSLVYRDGGEDGEQVTRRIIAGLPEHLAPGGAFQASCLLTDRVDGPVETRVRTMLGAAGDGFDVIVAAAAAADVIEYYFRRSIARQEEAASVERLAWQMREAGVVDIVLCTVLLVRHDAPRAPLTLRVRRGPRATGDDLLRLVARSRTRPDADGAFLDARPRLVQGATLAMSHVPQADGWAADEALLSVGHPFPRSLKTPPGMAVVLDACDGTRTTRELFARHRAAGGIPDDVTEPAFAAILGKLVQEGFLELDGTRGGGA